ncbi:AsmA family protein [Asticcacaulis sp.]|uniref:AsmA family protein n=1 Tax=Asticcacaulis sp. TaxID=1872648 RepID=UPI002BB62CF5|nr:AsmA family protein [Asticcacaulis sp.]HTM80762.1 AsmA family protein [Asticcacaulis sp.]
MISKADIAGIEARAVDWLRRAWAWLKHLPQALWMQLRALPRWGQGLLAAIVLVIGAILIFLAQPNWNWARPMVASLASGRVHRPVRIDGDLRVHLFSFTPTATVGGLKIGQPDWGAKAGLKPYLAEVDNLSVTAELMPVLVGRIVLPHLQVDRPNVQLYQDKDGRANWDFSNGKNKGKPTKLPPIRNFIINDGHLTLTSVQRKLTFAGTVNAHEKAPDKTTNAGGQAFALVGDGSLNNRKFELNATGGPLLNVRTSVPYPFDMVVRAGDTRITARGRVLHPFNLGELAGAVTVSGRNLADLYYLTGLTLPNTPAYRIAAQVTRNNRIYDIAGIHGRVGGSDLEGTLKVDTSRNNRPYLTGDLRSRLLDFKDLGSLFGATSANAPQGAEISATPTAKTPARRLLPDATLDIERVRGMDARVRYRALAVKAIHNMPLRAVSLGIDLDHGLMILDPVEFSFPQGRLQGTARIDARNAVQQNSLDMRLTGLRVQDFIPNVGGSKPLEGILDARVKASGTGNSVHKAAASANGQLTLVMPRGTIRQSFAELMGVNATKGLFQLLTKDPHQTDVRCGVADFQIRNGVMQASNAVFDTGITRVNGGGTINLNDESLKLVFKGKPKKFRLIRINAPIVIGGHLSAPKFGIDAGPAAVQGGLALALNTILPFVNIDYAKDANCAALISDMPAKRK